MCLADEIAWGDVGADGSLDQRSLDVPVAHTRGAENFYVENPMDSYDWSHTAVVRNSLKAQVKAFRRDKAKFARLQEELRPIFTALPKDADGRLNNGTARYALHRLFSEKHGWAIKGLQPAGAAWMATMSVTPDVKDVTKYMVPSYLQDQLLAELGMSGFDLDALAILASTLEHLIDAEMKSIVYSAFTTLGLPVPGKRSEAEVDEILDTFMMVYAFGLNLDASMHADVRNAKAHLAGSHSGWPQMQAFAKRVRMSISHGELDFQQIVQVVTKIGEDYVNWQGKDCMRVKDELKLKGSHHAGRVLLSEVTQSPLAGQRTLFTDSAEDLEKYGVLTTASDGAAKEVIIPNYINSQTMCLSTASFYTACCVNECESILGKLEREVAAPAVAPAQLVRLISAMPGLADQNLIGQLHDLVDQSTGLVALHGRGLAGWMNQAFPLECPAPHNQKVTNPKTPDEWMERDDAVADLEEMISEIAQVASRYTTMGKKDGQVFVATDELSDFNADVVRVHKQAAENVFVGSKTSSLWYFFGVAFRLAAMASMIGGVVVVGKSGFLATGNEKKNLKASFKDFV